MNRTLLFTGLFLMQVICIPIPNSKLTDEQRSGLNGKILEITDALCNADVRAQNDTRDNYTPGWKYNHWELKGVPIRLEVMRARHAQITMPMMWPLYLRLHFGNAFLDRPARYG